MTLDKRVLDIEGVASCSTIPKAGSGVDCLPTYGMKVTYVLNRNRVNGRLLDKVTRGGVPIQENPRQLFKLSTITESV